MVTASVERFPEVKTLASGYELVSSLPSFAWLSPGRRECAIAISIYSGLLRYSWRESTTTDQSLRRHAVSSLPSPVDTCAQNFPCEFCHKLTSPNR